MELQPQNGRDHHAIPLPVAECYSLMHDQRREEYLDYGVRLYKAALKGDWRAARKIFADYPECRLTERITRQGDTILHIAAVARRTDFVKQLVRFMQSRGSIADDVAMTNDIGNTALCLAAASGNVSIAKIMVGAYDQLPLIRGSEGMTPLCMAALFGHREMVNYLLPLTRDDLLEHEWKALFFDTIKTDLYDIALEILEDNPQLATARDEQEETPLHVLANSQMPRGQQLGIWGKFCCLVNACGSLEENSLHPKALKLVEKIWRKVLREPQCEISRLMGHPWPVLFKAVELGNVEFVTTLIRFYPDVIWKLDNAQRQRSIFHVAVEFRQKRIFRLIYEIGAIKDLLASYVDETNGNNMLHLSAILPSSDRLNCSSGPALQMQREMWWFKVIEDLVQPQLAIAKNNNHQTPRALFTEQHRDLRKEGEEWMRKTASSCSVVATLIASVMFAAALKMPGSGQGASDEYPLARGWQYWMFALSDSMSLLSGTASILMFLSILTSRYAEDDFLRSLPLKLMIGLTLLFVSIATMMVAFTATFKVIFKHGLLWVGIAILACFPIFLFALQEFPLLMEVYRSTIGCNICFKRRHRLF